MNKNSKYLFQKMMCDINSTSLLNHILLVDGMKKDNVSKYLSDDIDFITCNSCYNARLSIDEITGFCRLDFTLFNSCCSKELLSYILNYLTCEDKYFYRSIDGVIVHDFHNDLLEIKQINIKNTIIDGKTIDILNKYFNNLKIINFIDCIIDDSCSIYNLNNEIIVNFVNCEFNNIKSLSYCKQKLNFVNPKFNKITNVVINSKEITFECVNDTILTNLFLMCNFPDLNKLVIGEDMPHQVNENMYFDKSLKYMPYACYDVINLYLQGKVRTFDFLYHFNQLSQCEIRSICDSVGIYEIYNPYIGNKNERNKIINNKFSINNELDINLTIYNKLFEIIKFLNIVKYSSNEKHLYLDKDGLSELILNPLKGFKHTPVEYMYIYDSNNDSLRLDVVDKDNQDNFSIFNNHFYEFKKNYIGRNVRLKRQIEISKPFIYHPSNIPLIWDNSTIKQDELIKDACNSMFYGYQKDVDKDIEEKYDLFNKKKKIYYDKINKILIKYYDDFTVDELIQILNMVPNIDRNFIIYCQMYGFNLENDEDVIKKVNEKTNNQLVKCLNRIKMIEKQIDLLD